MSPDRGRLPNGRLKKRSEASASAKSVSCAAGHVCPLLSCFLQAVGNFEAPLETAITCVLTVDHAWPHLLYRLALPHSLCSARDGTQGFGLGSKHSTNRAKPSASGIFYIVR